MEAVWLGKVPGKFTKDRWEEGVQPDFGKVETKDRYNK